MHELWIEVNRVEGACSGPVPMVPGVRFAIQNGRLIFPGGGPICLFALQSLMPLLPAKERLTDGDPAVDRMGRVHDIQCPDPDGRVTWRIHQTPIGTIQEDSVRLPASEAGDLLIEVERIDGRCIEGMCVGHRALLRESSLYLAQPFCLYAMQALLPILPGKQRTHEADDWMQGESHVICPDPLGNVVFRIELVT